MSLLLTGGGALLGAAGSAMQAHRAKSDATRARRRQRDAIANARAFTGGTTVTTGKKFFGDPGSEFQAGALVGDQEVEKGVATFIDPVTGERKFGGRVDEIMADPLLANARSFLEGTFSGAADSPLAQDFAKGIAAAQSARGTFFGGAGISAEAGGLAAFSQRLRQDLLPSMMQFGTLGESLRQSVLGFEAPMRTAAATGGTGHFGSSNLGGPNPFTAGLQGLFSGGAAGFMLGREFLPSSTAAGILGESSAAFEPTRSAIEEEIGSLMNRRHGSFLNF